MGEFEIIEGIRARAEKVRHSESISLGIGDDCCLIAPAGDEQIAVSTDAFVEGVHFRFEYFDHFEAGARAMACALSDLAAMAAKPVGAVVSVAMPGNKSAAADGAELARGLIETGERWGCPLIGGDLCLSPGPVVITVTVLGAVPNGRAVLRSGARPGDEIWVTGSPGDAAAVLACLEASLGNGQGDLPVPDRGLINSFKIPSPRLEQALLLAGSGGLSAMIDISDGLAADLGHILDASGVGAHLESNKFPISGFFGSVAASGGLSPEHYFLYGGEDYELCLTAPPGALEGKGRLLEKKHGTPLARIGTITGTRGELVIEQQDGRVDKINRKGFDHFA
ncbi:MAG: thiamine-phosphate kinase [Gemmatimonadota bacterium]|nr:thiamine-phosphate kinase [Gemmatimonadota bacterium]